MSIRKILLYPENEIALRRKCESVESMSQNVRRLVRDLKDTLKNHSAGLGLAAPQINIHERVIVFRLGSEEAARKEVNPPIALINPVILAQGDPGRDFDGCLSFPGLYGKTTRPHYLRVSGIDESGKPFDREFEGFDAVVVHHEIDHLDGVLFIDHVEQLEDLYRMVENDDGMPVRVPLSVASSPGEDPWISAIGRI